MFRVSITSLSPCDSYCFSFQGGNSDADHALYHPSIVIIRYMAAQFADSYHVLMLTLWSSTSMAAHLTKERKQNTESIIVLVRQYQYIRVRFRASKIGFSLLCSSSLFLH